MLSRELNHLLDIERKGLLANLESLDPHVDARAYPIWRTLKRLPGQAAERAAELESLLGNHAVDQATPTDPAPALTWLSYMRLDHLLPYLVREKEEAIATCERALAGLPAGGAPEGPVLERHRDAHRAELEAIQKHQATLAA